MKTLTLINLNYQSNPNTYFECLQLENMPCMLDSCNPQLQNNNNRYDIITANPTYSLYTYANGKTTISNFKNNQTTHVKKDPFQIISSLLNEMHSIKDDSLPFTGGAIGFWGYELITLLESKLKTSHLKTPLMAIGLYDWALITDHLLQKTQLVFHPDCPLEKQKKTQQLFKKNTSTQTKPFKLTSNFQSNMSKKEYKSAFQTIKDYIYAGDCYQINLTQKFIADYSGHSWHAYKLLRESSPAPFSAYLDYHNFQILSHSPERFLHIKNQTIESQPIKGTIARSTDPHNDKKNAQQLYNCIKNRAENLMIVDLLRNDLGKVCKTGSVNTPYLFNIESYINVHHLVSCVTGLLDDNFFAIDALQSAFPGGSITGAPKIRAMQIIQELEKSERNIYCGCIGYISTNHRMDTNIAIRSLFADNNHIQCWGGGAIVSDSNLHDEYQESIIKVKHLMDSLEKTLIKS